MRLQYMQNKKESFLLCSELLLLLLCLVYSSNKICYSGLLFHTIFYYAFSPFLSLSMSSLSSSVDLPVSLIRSLS